MLNLVLHNQKKNVLDQYLDSTFMRIHKNIISQKMPKRELIIKRCYVNINRRNKVKVIQMDKCLVKLRSIENSILILSIVITIYKYILGYGDHTFLKVLLMFTFVVSVTSAYIFFYKK